MQSKSFRCQILLTTFIVVILARQSALGATVTYTIEVDPGPGTWQLFGEASLGDNQGLALVSVDIINVNFPVDLQLPQSRLQILPSTDVGLEGFFDMRVDDNSGGITPIGGIQDTFGGSGVVLGFGQTAGSLTTGVANFFVQQNYDAKLLIAQGTYDNSLGAPLPWYGPGGSANVIDNVQDGTPPIEVLSADLTKNRTILSVPEPSALLLLVLGAGVVAGVRRRR